MREEERILWVGGRIQKKSEQRGRETESQRKERILKRGWSILQKD